MGIGLLGIGILLRESMNFIYLFIFVSYIVDRTTDITITASRGEHLLHCEIMKETHDPKGGTEFRIIAVDAL